MISEGKIDVQKANVKRSMSVDECGNIETMMLMMGTEWSCH